MRNTKNARIEIGEEKWDKWDASTNKEVGSQFTDSDAQELAAPYDPFVELLAKEKDESTLSKDQIADLVGKVEGEE